MTDTPADKHTTHRSRYRLLTLLVPILLTGCSTVLTGTLFKGCPDVNTAEASRMTEMTLSQPLTSLLPGKPITNLLTKPNTVYNISALAQQTAPLKDARNLNINYLVKTELVFNLDA